jgi:hypothetical protein
MPSFCKSCEAKITWVKTAAGRPMPLDFPGEKRVVVQDGIGYVLDTYISHFATCPNADLHRKPKGES